MRARMPSLFKLGADLLSTESVADGEILPGLTKVRQGLLVAEDVQRLLHRRAFILTVSPGGEE